MYFRVENLWVYVEDAAFAELHALRALFATWEPVPKNGQPARVLFNGEKFPRGLLPLVEKKFRSPTDTGPPWHVEDAPPRAHANLRWLRDYQRTAFDIWLRHGRGILDLPVGSGKGELIAAAVLEVQAPWLVLVPRSSLVDQTLDRLALRGVQDAVRIRRPGRVIVSTVQAFTRGKRKRDPAILTALETSRGLIADEVHAFAAPTAWDIVMSTPAATYRLGLSATPLLREDRADAFTIAAFGPLLHRVDVRDLLEQNAISHGVVEFSPIFHTGVEDWQVWNQVYLKHIVYHRERNARIVQRAITSDPPTLVFVKRIDHGELLQRALIEQDVETEFVFGKDDGAARQTAIRRLRDGEIQVLISSPIFEEGIDIPELRTVIVASAGKSAIRSVQRLGRATRTAEGKIGFRVHDFADYGHPWLARHTERRAASYALAGFTPIGLPIAPASTVTFTPVGDDPAGYTLNALSPPSPPPQMPAADTAKPPPSWGEILALAKILLIVGGVLVGLHWLGSTCQK